MTLQSVTDLITILGECHLLRPAQLRELDQRLRPRFAEPKALLQALQESGWLTAYQVKSLLQGQASGLVLGPFVILDRLGEGGMGQVFKARQQGLDRVVALKVLRQELVSDSEAVGRFYREIKVASQLPEHPNLVRAFDAGPLGATHFLAMEYVAGTDLERLVKQSRPLAVAQACEYIRQAALGLQHAHHHGLVHRDIKPSNLLVSRAQSPESRAQVRESGSGLSALDSGLIKILDLGLARLQAGNKNSSRENTFLTSDGPVTLGTVDYQAPEQALDFHRADIRADIYSLGCTCYYLLTGKPPFGSGPLAIKLMRHQQAEPPDLKERRGDVPDGLVAIVRRMLSKRPADRYQTPGEVADELASLNRRVGVAVPPSAGILSQGLAATARFSFVCCRGAWGRAKDHPRLVLPLVGLLLLLVGSIVFFSPKDAETLRQEFLKIRLEHPGTPKALAAAEEFMKLPSPLDQLDPKSIPPDGRLPKDPKELVAVLGKPGQHARGAAFSPDGKLLASGGDDGRIRLWDSATGEERATLNGHETPVVALAFAPDGKTLASASADVRLWDLASGKEQANLKTRERVMCLAFAPDGKTLAAGITGGVVKLWDVAAHRERVAFTGMGHLVFSLAYAPDGQTVAVASYQQPVTFWNVASGTKRAADELQAIFALAYAPDGRTLVLASQDKAVKLWDVTAGKESAALPFGGDGRQLAMAPDGKRLVLTTPRGLVTLVSFPIGEKLQQWQLPFGAPIQYDAAYVPAFAPDGRHLAVAGDNGKVYIFRLHPLRIEK